MPAEWERQACVWLVRPHNPETWPSCLDQAQVQWDAFVDVLRRYTPVSLVEGLGIATNDSWVRDFGPIFVVSPSEAIGGRLGAHDFRFNGWGDKYEQRELDDAVPRQIADRLGVALWRHDLVLEGGSIEVNGRGTVMTTEQCLLNPNRNPSLTRSQLEAKLHETLGTTHCIWLPGGIVGDDTDGHIDDIARFVSPDTVVAVAPPSSHADHAMLSRNLDALQQARDQDDRPLTVIKLPAPEPIYYDFPADRFGPGGRAPVPASYANFLISNGAVIVPVFGQASDDEAVRILEDAMPGYTVEPVRAEHLVVGLGAFHCLSQQQPAV